MVHWEKNLLFLFRVPAKERKGLSKYIKQIYASPYKEMALNIARLISTKYHDKYSKVAQFLEKDLEVTLTFFDYPDTSVQDTYYESNRGSIE